MVFNSRKGVEGKNIFPLYFFGSYGKVTPARQSWTSEANIK
jgi:hypothetical protein